VFGGGFLDHAAEEILWLFRGSRRVLFVPYALLDLDGAAEQVRRRLAPLGLEVDSTHAESDPARAVRDAEGIFVGGGNTFRLLDALQRLGLVAAIRDRVEAGAPYLGSSAGAIVAGPTLKTTKDMPVVEPASFDALGLVPFQISPHYLDPDPSSTHMGETQEERIRQYHEENALPVAGIREGAMLRGENGEVTLCGTAGVRIFRRGLEPVEAWPVRRVDALLRAEGPS
jgi:dipeptidase E